MRFKPPPVNSNIGWRVEFRPTEVRTASERSSFTALAFVSAANDGLRECRIRHLHCSLNTGHHDLQSESTDPYLERKKIDGGRIEIDVLSMYVGRRKHAMCSTAQCTAESKVSQIGRAHV